MKNTYYNGLVDATKEYLGPAAERFINRQISFHLEKNPEDITQEDTLRLSEWIQTALSLITNDKKMVANAAKRIREITK